MANITSIQLGQTVFWLQAVSTQLWILLHMLVAAQKATSNSHLCCACRKLCLFELLFLNKKQTLSLYNVLFGSEVLSTPTALSQGSEQKDFTTEVLAVTPLASSQHCSRQVFCEEPICDSHFPKQVGSTESEDSIQRVIGEEPF